MKPIWVERLLQPQYGWNWVKRTFWGQICRLRLYRVPKLAALSSYAHHQWLTTLISTHGWSTQNGKDVYFEESWRAARR